MDLDLCKEKIKFFLKTFFFSYMVLSTHKFMNVISYNKIYDVLVE